MLSLLLQATAMTTPAPAPAPGPAEMEVRAASASGAEAAQFWAQAGLGWLEAGEAGRARVALDRALSQPLPRAAQGELRLHRARADAALNDPAAARADLDAAVALLPGDPVPLVLSASFARRTGDFERASRDLEAAWALASDDPLVLLESGRLALAAGEPEQASVAWRRVLAGSANEAKAEARDGLRSLGLKVD